MAKGMRLNRPKKASHRNLQKLGRMKKQQRKKQRKTKDTSSNLDPLITNEILKKRRTNPKANITLSSKKRRLLTKKLQREETRSNQMDLVVEKKVEEKPESKNRKKTAQNETMDVDK